MATKGKMNHYRKRAAVIAKYRPIRAELREVLKSGDTSIEAKEEARKKMDKLPRLSMENRHRNRCELTGRPRAVYRKFKLYRMAFRKLALQGLLPGVTKSSW